jgi:hypothetical protein
MQANLGAKEQNTNNTLALLFIMNLYLTELALELSYSTEFSKKGSVVRYESTIIARFSCAAQIGTEERSARR